MTGVRIEINRADLTRVNALVSRLAGFEPDDLVAEIVQLGEGQTRARIEAGGPAPDGTPWAPNLEGTPILFRTGRNLHDSIASVAQGDHGEWGAAWEFAHVHQYGAVITPKDKDRLAFAVGGKRVFAKKVTIPARPFVGVSHDDERDIRDLVTDYLGRAFR